MLDITALKTIGDLSISALGYVVLALFCWHLFSQNKLDRQIYQDQIKGSEDRAAIDRRMYQDHMEQQNKITLEALKALNNKERK